MFEISDLIIELLVYSISTRANKLLNALKQQIDSQYLYSRYCNNADSIDNSIRHIFDIFHLLIVPTLTNCIL